MDTDSSKLSCFLTEDGGIIDDLIITARRNHHALVVNAGNFDKDVELLQQALDAFPGEVFVEVLKTKALLALQGPASARVLQELLGQAVNLRYVDFMTCVEGRIGDVPVTLTRCGYTGEDGFEISVENEHAVAVADTILGRAKTISGASETSHLLAGLVARDVLRIEAGLCLYGKDIDETVTPVEAGLAWVVGKRRRASGGFPGEDVVLTQLKEGASRKRMGLIVAEGAGVAREGCDIYLGEEDVGKVTSGTFSPVLKRSVGIGYISTAASEEKSLKMKIRDKLVDAEITKLPFVKHKYYRAPKE
jgi:aminomethyltransferase